MSKSWRKYAGPDGGRIPNLGEVDAISDVDEGYRCGMKVQVAEVLGQAETAFIALDKEGVAAAVVSLDAAVPCVDYVLTPPMAARVHRIKALGVFLAGEHELAQQHFSAANVASRGEPLSEDLVPAGHPLHHLYVGAGGLFEATEAVDDIAGAQLYFDGTGTLERPVQRPVLVQAVGDDQTVLLTEILPAGQDVPAFDVPITTAVVLPEEGETPSPGGGRKRLALAGAVGGALASGAMLAGSLWTGSAYWESESVALAEKRRLRTNGLIVGSGVGGAVAVGGVVGLVATKRF